MKKTTSNDWIANIVIDTQGATYQDIYSMVDYYEYVNIQTADDTRSGPMTKHMFIVPRSGMSDDLKNLAIQMRVTIIPKSLKMTDGVVRDGFAFNLRAANNAYLALLVTKAVKNRRGISAVSQHTEYIQSQR